MELDEQKECQECFRIICKNCGWEANADEVKKVQAGLITVCPTCGWHPS